jgi:hypothetical protein
MALSLQHAPLGDNDNDYDVLSGWVHFVSQAAPQDRQWMWTIAYGHHEGLAPTRSYEHTHEAAMAAFAKSWRQES